MLAPDGLGSSIDRPHVDELEEVLAALTWFGQRQLAMTLAPFQLTVSQFFTLLAVADHPEGVPMSALARQTGHALASMTGVIDRLVDHGLVERRDKPGDRRVVLITLTAAGRARLVEAQGVRREQLQAAFNQLRPADQGRLLRLLQAFTAALGVGVGEAPPAEGRPRRSTRRHEEHA